jgi:hypothetical protein
VQAQSDMLDRAWDIMQSVLSDAPPNIELERRARLHHGCNACAPQDWRIG